MRSEKFYAAIGVFVIGAFILTFAGTVFFYQQYVHAKQQIYVMFFKGSLKGLDSVSPVTYRGVKIGEVKHIEVSVNPSQEKVMIPVYVEFSVEKKFGYTENPIHLMIKNGYIAQVAKPNFITGVAEIELIQANPQSRTIQEIFNGYPVFPTRHVVEKTITLDESLQAAKQTFDAIRTLVSSKEIKDMIKSTQAMSKSMDKLAANLDQYLPSSMVYFNQTMSKISDAATSTQNLADYLARNPETLLRGR